jgi:hypothetical protein
VAPTPQERRRYASAAARARWSRESDRTAGTEAARTAFLARFKGAPETRRAYFQALAQHRWRAERAKAAAQGNGDGSG